MAEEENEAPETLPEENTEKSSEVGANKFLVKERYEIDYSQPLPWLDSNGAKAFRVIDRIDTKRGLFALLCSNTSCPRSTILPYIKSIECRSLMKLVDSYPSVVKEAAEGYDPSLIASFLYEVAKTFSHYYHDHTVLSKDDEKLTDARVALSSVVLQVMKNAFSLLGIPYLEIM